MSGSEDYSWVLQHYWGSRQDYRGHLGSTQVLRGSILDLLYPGSTVRESR